MKPGKPFLVPILFWVFVNCCDGLLTFFETDNQRTKLSRWESKRCKALLSGGFSITPPICHSSLSTLFPSDATLHAISLHQATAHFIFEVCKRKSFFLSSATNFEDFLREESHLRKIRVKEAVRHVWAAYENNAMGADEINPASGRPLKHWGGLPVMLIDGLDTLWLAGLKSEFSRAVEWLENRERDDAAKMNSTQDMTADGIGMFAVDMNVNLFETTIRQLGGLLSAYELSGRQYGILLRLSESLAKRLIKAFPATCEHELPVFRNNSHCTKYENGKLKLDRLPHSDVNLLSGVSDSPIGSHLAEVGSLQLELKTLSEITANCHYSQLADATIELLENSLNISALGLAPTHLLSDGTPGPTKTVTLGSKGDSFFEYLLKEWLLTDRQDIYIGKMVKRFLNAVSSLYTYINKPLVKHSLAEAEAFSSPWRDIHGTLPDGNFSIAMPNELTTLNTTNILIQKADHLTCFLPGMLALTLLRSDGLLDLSEESKAKLFSDAEKLLSGCIATYFRTATGLAPEITRFSLFGLQDDRNSMHSLIRPETVESIFYLWRLTHDIRYRNFGWRIFLALERWSKAPYGYTSVGNVQLQSKEDTRGDLSAHGPRMHTFVFAETLKYLHLLYSSDEVLDLSRWVLNTEAHPLPVMSNPSGGRCGRVAQIKNIK